MNDLVKRSGLTHKEIAQRLGISTRTLRRWLADPHPQAYKLEAVRWAVGRVTFWPGWGLDSHKNLLWAPSGKWFSPSLDYDWDVLVKENQLQRGKVRHLKEQLEAMTPSNVIDFETEIKRIKNRRLTD